MIYYLGHLIKLSKIKTKISELTAKLETLAQARILRTGKLSKKWGNVLNKMDAQSSVSIDYTKFPSNEEAKKFIFGSIFQSNAGGDPSSQTNTNNSNAVVYLLIFSLLLNYYN